MMSSQRLLKRQRRMSGTCRQRHLSAATLERNAPRGTFQDERTKEMRNKLVQERGLKRLKRRSRRAMASAETSTKRRALESSPRAHRRGARWRAFKKLDGEARAGELTKELADEARA